MSEEKKPGLEKALELVTDIVFSVWTIGVLFVMFTEPEFLDGGIGLALITGFMAMGLLAICHKITKVILGTIGRSFDGVFNK